MSHSDWYALCRHTNCARQRTIVEWHGKGGAKAGSGSATAGCLK